MEGFLQGNTEGAQVNLSCDAELVFLYSGRIPVDFTLVPKHVVD
jgi:hypothetical protein